MLILGRRTGESIIVDGGIRIVVVSSDRRGVRLGIEAPEHVGIVRGEIATQIAEENHRAQQTAVASEWLAALAPRLRGSADTIATDASAADTSAPPPSAAPTAPPRAAASGER